MRERESEVAMVVTQENCGLTTSTVLQVENAFHTFFALPWRIATQDYFKTLGA